MSAYIRNRSMWSLKQLMPFIPMAMSLDEHTILINFEIISGYKVSIDSIWPKWSEWFNQFGRAHPKRSVPQKFA